MPCIVEKDRGCSRFFFMETGAPEALDKKGGMVDRCWQQIQTRDSLWRTWLPPRSCVSKRGRTHILSCAPFSIHSAEDKHRTHSAHGVIVVILIIIIRRRISMAIAIAMAVAITIAIVVVIVIVIVI